MKLSVIVPGIRKDNWEALWRSINLACTSHSWEMIIISPYELPEALAKMDNITWIHSFRSPIACQQMGLCASKGTYVTWAADDGVYLPQSLNIALKRIEELDPHQKRHYIIAGKYHEGDAQSGMDDDWYYHLYNHESCRLPYVPRDSIMLNCGVVSRDFLVALGGWDSLMFEVCPFAYNDFAIRALKAGAVFEIQKELMFKCAHEPGMMGTHGPIHIAQTEHDEMIFKALYIVDFLPRLKIDINNWEKTPEVWKRRFGEGKV